MAEIGWLYLEKSLYSPGSSIYRKPEIFRGQRGEKEIDQMRGKVAEAKRL